ncbi:MAG TPA: hypothetical protein VHF88_02935 [Thermoleophilaceae bacterium]|nr:hypothetical protein [Thermoleophilaceae bacterium]
MRRPLPLALALVTALLIAFPPAAAADGPIIRYECTYQPAGGEWWNIPDCKPNVTPWISVGKLGHSGWKLYCPGGAPFSYQNVLNAGFAFTSNSTDWSRSSKWIDAPTATGSRYTGNGKYPDWLYYKGQTLNPGDFSSGWVDAFVVNWDPFHDHSWRYAMGCAATNAVEDPSGVQVGPIPGGPDGDDALDYDNVVATADPPAGAARTAQSSDGPAAPQRRSIVAVRRDGRIERLRELPLRPRRTTRVTVRCAKGERLVRGSHSVAYDTRRPPRTHRHNDVAGRTRRAYSVRVKVGRVAPRTVWLQARAICQR